MPPFTVGHIYCSSFPAWPVVQPWWPSRTLPSRHPLFSQSTPCNQRHRSCSPCPVHPLVSQVPEEKVRGTRFRKHSSLRDCSHVLVFAVRFFTCFILASSLRVWSSLRRSFLFPTRIMGTLGQKCFTSGVHFSGMFSKEGDTSSQKRDTATGDMQARRLISGGETYSWSSMTMLV